MIWDEKFRLGWLSFLPPHPSLSLTWVFTLGFTPWLYYLAARRLLDSNAARSAVLLLLCSAGFLSGVAMWLRPAKPMSVFAMALALHLATKLEERISRREGDWDSVGLGVYFGLLLTVFSGFFFDETAWFTVVAVPLYCPRLFRDTQLRPLVVTSWLLLFPSFLAIVTFLVPCYFPDFQFWNYAVASNQSLHKLRLGPYLANPLYLLGSQMSWVRHGWPALSWVLFHGLGLLWLAKVTSLESSRLWRLALVPALFLIFETLLLTRQSGTVDTSYYYASLFPLFFSLFLAGLLSRVTPKLRLALVGYLMVISIHHFELINQRWRTANAGNRLEPSRARVWQLWRLDRARPLTESEKGELEAMTPGIAVEMTYEEKTRAKGIGVP